jgi:hypothetical protein
MVSWPAGVRTKVLRDTTWDLPSGTIADKTRSGKYKVRAGHASEPKSFRVTMRMYLDEYRIFEDWYINITRKGTFSFAFPKINDNSAGIINEYRFNPGSKLSVSNPGGLVVEVGMEWLEV